MAHGRKINQGVTERRGGSVGILGQEQSQTTEL